MKRTLRIIGRTFSSMILLVFGLSGCAEDEEIDLDFRVVPAGDPEEEGEIEEEGEPEDEPEPDDGGGTQPECPGAQGGGSEGGGGGGARGHVPDLPKKPPGPKPPGGPKLVPETESECP
jgi:hypothetical protein